MKSAAIGFSAFLLSVTGFQYFRISGILFNTGILLIVLSAIFFEKKQTLIAVSVYACFVDLFASRFLGIHVLIYAAILFLVFRAVDLLYRGSVLLPVLLSVGSTFVFHLLYYFVLIVFRISPPFAILVRILAVETLYNAALGFVCYLILNRMTGGGRQYV